MAPAPEKAGSPVAVSITLINQSDKTLSVSLLDFADDYTVDVTDAQSAPAPDSQDVRKARREMDACRNLGKAVCGQKWGHGVIGQVKPGETWSERLLITKYHDMSRPGKYTIQLERKLPEELGPGTVKSNPITITMTE